MANGIEEALQMIEDCEQRESKLTEWEQTFIQSLHEHLDNDKPLSEKQAETLEKIWERVT